MDKIFTHSTSFMYYRIPPLVHELYGDYPDISLLLEKHAVLRSGAYGPFDLPLHVLVTDKAQNNVTKTCKTHVWGGELLPGMVLDADYGFSVASPAFTLLNLAATTSVLHLTMMLYEMMGSFAVYRPSEDMRRYLQGLVDAGRLPMVGGWKPMLNRSGKLTDLWSRPPLLMLEGAWAFVDQMQSVRGVGRLKRALQNVWGEARSPFEVQTALLLGLPRRNGGYGFGPFELNKRIRLSPSARSLASQNVCYADLYLEASEVRPALIIECQGADYHEGSERNALDDNRALALQSMGFVVVRLRYEQLCDPWRLQCVARYLGRELGIPWIPKSEGLEQKERVLRSGVLIDWWTLGRDA